MCRYNLEIHPLPFRIVYSHIMNRIFKIKSKALQEAISPAIIKQLENIHT